MELFVGKNCPIISMSLMMPTIESGNKLHIQYILLTDLIRDGNLTLGLERLKNKAFLQKREYIFRDREVKIKTEHVKSNGCSRRYWRLKKHMIFFLNILCRQHPFLSPSPMGERGQPSKLYFSRLSKVSPGLVTPWEDKEWEVSGLFIRSLIISLLLGAIFRSRILGPVFNI